jgi:hypothetical protein
LRRAKSTAPCNPACFLQRELLEPLLVIGPAWAGTGCGILVAGYEGEAMSDSNSDCECGSGADELASLDLQEVLATTKRLERQ